MDLCSGQFRSTVVCPDCKLVSKTFDPYFSVSVPLVKESATEFTLPVVVVRAATPGLRGAFGAASESHNWAEQARAAKLLEAAEEAAKEQQPGEGDEEKEALQPSASMAANNSNSTTSPISKSATNTNAASVQYRKTVKLVLPKAGPMAAVVCTCARRAGQQRSGRGTRHRCVARNAAAARAPAPPAPHWARARGRLSPAAGTERAHANRQRPRS